MGKYVTTHNNTSKREKWSRVVYEVVVAEDGSEFPCECGQFEHTGMLCCHLFRVMGVFHLEEIQPKHIMKSWTSDARGILSVPYLMAPSVLESAASGTTRGTHGGDAGAGKEFQLTDGSSFGSATSAWSTNLLAVDDNRDDEEGEVIHQEPNQEKLLNVEMEDKGTDSGLEEGFGDHDPAAVAASAYYGGKSDEDHGSGVIYVAG